MSNKNPTDKVSLNDKLINIVIFLLFILLICVAIISVIGWIKTNDLFFIIFGFISILGVLFNIYIFSRRKSKK
jgi:membrane protein YdbS with pleckstrin-like domain